MKQKILATLLVITGYIVCFCFVLAIAMFVKCESDFSKWTQGDRGVTVAFTLVAWMLTMLTGAYKPNKADDGEQ